MSDFQGEIQSQRGPLKNLLSKVPGFKGYLEKEDRRTADKMMRETVADRYAKVLDQLTAIQTDMTDQGMLEYVDDLESVVTKVQTFVDRVRHASYGYSSFFSAVKTGTDTLDRLYEYDQALLKGADQMEEVLLSLESAESEPDVEALLEELDQLARDLLHQFDSRKEVITSQ